MKLTHLTNARTWRGIALLAGCLMLAACGAREFKIKGTVYGAEDKPIVLEKSDFHGRWIPLDSTRTDGSGNFILAQPVGAAPDVYRLVMDGKVIYLPVDSTETVKVETSADDFGRKYTLSGSHNAEAMQRFDAEVMALPAGVSPDSLNAFKRRVYTEYMRDAQGSVVAYYILTKTIDGKPLYDPVNDHKYFAAVATGFKAMRPDDPRTALLERTTLQTMRTVNAGKGEQIVLEAPEITVLEIDLPDEDGKNRKLSDLVGKGKPVLVLFSVLTHPDAPAMHAALSKIASQADIYQVSIDPDQYAWREAARNLPWTTVFDADGEYSKYLRTYNVSEVPVFFVYNAKGELTARAHTLDELRKYL